MDGGRLYLQPGKKLLQASYVIYDLNGRPVYKRAPGKLEAGQVINIFTGTPSLPAGTYILKLKDGTDDISQHRFVIP